MRRVGFVIVPYIISRMFDKKVDIEGAKVNIENKKVDIGGSKVDIRKKSGHSKEIIVVSAREFYRTPNILK